MKSFKSELIFSIKRNYRNNFGKENYDELRFGTYNKKITHLQRIKNLVKNIHYKFNENIVSKLDYYESDLQWLWENLNENDKVLLIEIIAFRLMGFTKVKLPVNNKIYWEKLELCSRLINGNDTIDPKFLHFLLYKTYLNEIGYDINLYSNPSVILADFILEQYAYKFNGENIVCAEKNDVVFDIGGCWGDTALYFSHYVGKNGKVFSFEFIPQNINIHDINTSLNPLLKKRIELIQQPIIDKSDVKVYFEDNGPGSSVKYNPFNEQTGKTITISIDDFVARNSIDKVDFIKMDIEGAELAALYGAENTIRKFKPKLAIAIYHSMDDFTKIPKWILNLNIDYQLYLGHYTIHAEETIIFAKHRNK